ncbi:elongation factor G, partial [Candidatus Calescamantes bacterium]|nr:elongation factor G [Candidatus Calescamantes bacterium]
ELQLNMNLEKLSRYGVNVVVEEPKIPYRETIKGTAKAQGKYKRQTGGRGQYGDCWLELTPRGRGEGFEFVNKIVGGAIPARFIPSVEKGVREAMGKGPLAGYPVVDIQVTCYDGSFHPVDSSDIAFQIAGSMAFKNAYPQANPTLLEPIMKAEIKIPEEYLGDITGDLNARRGKILSIDAEGRKRVVKVLVPLAELHRYAIDLKSMTQGRGTFTMEFSHYEEVPAHLQTKIIEEAKKEEKK